MNYVLKRFLVETTWKCTWKLTLGKGLISAESVYKCICCAKVFSCRKSLKVHMVTIAEGRLSSCQTCANPSSSRHNLKMHMIAQAQALPMQTLKTFVLKQTMWLCNFSCRQFEDTFEKSKWRKVKQMQPMWLCLFTGRQFEDIFENTQWIKVKQMQWMWLCRGYFSNETL